jgi:hypothetical protein
MYPHLKQMISQHEASEEGEQGDVWPTNVNAIMGISDKQCINKENHGDFKYKYQPVFDNHLCYVLMEIAWVCLPLICFSRSEVYC